MALLILPAGAQQAPQGTPSRIRGTVEKLDGQDLSVKSREGEIVTIALADNVAVAYLVKKNVGDIKPGDYIASTGIKGTDGLHTTLSSPSHSGWKRSTSTSLESASGEFISTSAGVVGRGGVPC